MAKRPLKFSDDIVSRAQTYRFGDAAALWIGATYQESRDAMRNGKRAPGGRNVYIPPDLARKIARQLYAIARDIEQNSYGAGSTAKSIEHESRQARKAGKLWESR